MILSLYRKWRPKRFADVIGQDHVVVTLRHALQRQAVSHAYLFCGPRGVGKTTVARLLAKCVNCTNLANSKDKTDPCEKCPSCIAFQNDAMIDCLEIDAASNRGIDDIRALRDTVNFAPVLGTKKVYIIDEVHMLTKEAFNALLKTIEEPPEQVILILATTEIGKVPATIVSRCQRFDFRSIEASVLAKHLLMIAKSEKINLTLSGADLLAEAATGSGRDAISLFQQVSMLADSLDAENIASALGFVPLTTIDEFLGLLRHDQSAGIQKVKNILEKGFDPEQSIHAVLRAISRSVSGAKEQWSQGLDTTQLLNAGEEWAWALRQVKGHPDSFLVLAAAAAATSDLWREATVQNEVRLIESSKALNQKPIVSQAPVVEQADNTSTSDTLATLQVTTWQTDESDQKLWAAFIQATEPHHHSLVTLLRDAELLGIEDGEPPSLVVGVHFPFHKSRLTTIHNRRILEDLLQQITGKQMRLECRVVVGAPTLPQPTNKTTSEVSTEDIDQSENQLAQMAEQLFAKGS